jgi:hypothetical protein
MSKILYKANSVSFGLKSSVATAATLLVVYGGYFAVIGLNASERAIDEFAYKPLMIATVVPLALLMAITHGVMGALSPDDANTVDERDRQIGWRSASLSGYVLACGVFGVLVMLLLDVAPFYVANALLFVWVLAELAHHVSKIWLYSRMNG